MARGASAAEDRTIVRRPPRLPHDLLDRQALYDRLDLLAPLTVLRGPAGAGKSTLIAAWIKRRCANRVVAWLGFNVATDHDRFWRLISGAITGKAVEETGESFRVADVVKAGRGLTEPLVLVLDDLHHVDKVVGDGLARLARECSQLHLVVCLRGGHEFQSAVWRVPSTVVIGSSDLVVSADETAVLAECSGVVLDDGEAAEIHRATDGWMGPTRAALVVIGAAPPEKRLQSALAEAGSFVLGAVAQVEPAAVRTLLLTPCSVVEEFSAELADELCDAPDPQELLRKAEEHGLVMARTVDGRQTYHVLPVLRDALMRELGDDRDRYRAAHERAARWYLKHGTPQLAVAHAAEAEQWTLVGDIVDAAFVTLVTRYPFALYRAMKDMPDEAMADRPRLRAARTVAMAVPGIRGPAAAAFKPATPVRLAVGESVSLRDAVALGSAQAVALRTTYEFTASCRVLDDIDAALAQVADGSIPDLDDVLPLLQLQWAICRFQAADLATATRDFSRAFYGGRRTESDFIARNAAAALGLIAAVCGDLPGAAEWLERELELPLDDVPAADLVRSWGDTARCLRALDLLDKRLADETKAAVGDGTQLNELWAVICYAGAQYALLFGEPMAMLGRINGAEQLRVGRRREVGLGGSLIAAAKTDLLLALGQGNRARQAAWEHDLAHPLVEVGRARVEMLTGDLEGARTRAVDLIWRSDTDYRIRLDLLLIDAVAALRQGEEDAALEVAGRALAVAETTRAVRPFAWVPRPDRERLLSPLAGGRRVLDKLDDIDVRDVFPPTVEVVSLSDRERVVLEKLAQTSSVVEIAEALVVSVNTVKTQRRSLYRKLGVNSREQALGVARGAGLLD